jgi:hypothetical protein
MWNGGTRAYRRGVAAVLAATALPYGYTLTVWSSGELLRAAHGVAGPGDIVLFVVGAAAGYAILRLAVGNVAPPGGGVDRRRAVGTGAVQVAAIAAALALAAAVATAPAAVAWPLAPLVSTSVYLGVVAVERSRELYQNDG